MEVKLNIKRKLQLEPSVLEEKIYNYLKTNSCHIIERGSGYVIFIDDKFSNRRMGAG